MTVNQRVSGSSPEGGALKKSLAFCRAFLLSISELGFPLSV